MTEPDAVTGPAAEQRLSAVLKVVTQLASMAALATALLYYFGWRRSEAQARALGADASVFGMSTQDFVLRSIDVVLIPVLLLLLAALAAAWGHRRLRGSRHAARVGSVLRYAWAGCLVGAIVLLVIAPDAGNLAVPFWFAGGLLGTWYGMSLRGTSSAQSPTTSLGVLVVLATLVAASLFWMTERVARVVGDARAQEITDDVAGTLEAVAVYSAKRLQLQRGDIEETALVDPEAAFRYRYDGLFLLQESGGKFFLITGDWSPGKGQLIVLPDNGSVRLSFGPGR